MATRALGAESALANPLQFALSPSRTPVAPLLRLLSRFDRHKVEAFIELSIAMLDLIDGDPDLEEDDPAGQCDEDGVNTAYERARDTGAGCPWSDPGEYEHP